MDVYKIKLAEHTDSSLLSCVNRIDNETIVVFEEIDCCTTMKSRKVNRDIHVSPTRTSSSSFSSESDEDEDEVKSYSSNKKHKKKLDSHSKNKKTKSYNFGPSINLDTLLEVLDGYEYLHKCIIIMTSNYPEKLDSALTRPGRIDFTYKFNYVSKNLLKRIFKFYKGVELIDEQIDKYYRDNITSAKLINQILLPNIKLSVDEILEKM